MNLKNKIFLSIGCCLIFISTTAISQISPPILNSDINWTDTGGEFDPFMGIFNATFNGVVDIEAAFNNGRRMEEIQLGVTTNALGNLVLPGGWDTMSDNDKALFILNDERAARNVFYSNAGITPTGMIFEGVEYNIAQLVQHHVEYLDKTGLFTHTGPCGLSSFNRIIQHPLIGNNVQGSTDCHEFLPFGENLALFFGSPVPLKLERSIYQWLYADSGAGWGHRQSCLYQGFNDNHGPAGAEGYIGIGIMGNYVAMDYFDPPASACDGVYFLTDSPVLPNQPADGSLTYNADWEFTAADGWTHYFDDNNSRLDQSDDFLLFSIERQNDFIGRVVQAGCIFDVEIGNGSGCVDLSSANYVNNAGGWFVMDRYFDITAQSQPSSNMNIRFYYTNDNFTDISGGGCATGLSVNEDLTFYKVSTGIDPDPNSGSHATMNHPADIIFLSEGASPSTSTWAYSSHGSDHMAEFMVSSFSGGGGGGSTSNASSPLPVRFTSFEGVYLKDKTVLLNWLTAGEKNNDYFVIERSSDGKQFTALGRIGGSGTTSEVLEYAYTDESASHGINYYRIKQVDYNGAYAYSKVISITVSPVLDVIISPNPFIDNLNIGFAELPESSYDINVYNLKGEVVSAITKSPSEGQKVFIDNLLSGTYLVEIISGGERYIQKIMKL